MNLRNLKKIPFAAYIDLTKPRILLMVLVTTALGFFLGGKGIASWPLLFVTLLGTALSCGGASALNHYLERDVDGKMERTKNRPLPKGIITPQNALSFGVILTLSGVIILDTYVNLLTAFLSLLTAFLYILVYTPMKRLSWLNTTIGAIPGAIPPMGGWAAASGDLGVGAWVLFFILFAWQHPHFYSIAWMFKEDYGRGGFKMLPVVEPDGKKTFLHIRIFAVLLILVSTLPTVIGMSGYVYLTGAMIAGTVVFLLGVSLSSSKSLPAARRLLRATVIYLPLLLFLIVLDAGF